MADVAMERGGQSLLLRAFLDPHGNKRERERESDSLSLIRQSLQPLHTVEKRKE
jgi:hypothetical protein